MPVSTLPRQLAVLFCSLVAWASAADSRGVVRVTHGQPMNLADYIVPGKTTVIGFFSQYSPNCPCEPCARLKDPMAALQAARDDLAVVVVDINRDGVTRIDWTSPVAMQFGLHSLPYFMVFGPDGKLETEDNQQFGAAPARDLVHGMIEALPEHATTQVAGVVP